ncbi:MAG: hypothetical protein WC889_20665, partial [Myxococcota bacterium]
MTAYEPLLFGKYMLIQRLGTGGMAEAFLARSITSSAGGRKIVLKRMLDKHLNDQTVRSEFL